MLKNQFILINSNNYIMNISIIIRYIFSYKISLPENNGEIISLQSLAFPSLTIKEIADFSKLVVYGLKSYGF